VLYVRDVGRTHDVIIEEPAAEAEEEISECQPRRLDRQ